MQIFRNLILSITFLVTTSSHGQIQTISRLRQIIQHLNPSKRNLVIFDIDNTLLTTPTDLGSDHWLCHHMQQGLKFQDLAELYFHIGHKIELVPTEPDLLQTMAEIERNCDHVICLTARSGQIMERTLTQLKLNQLEFHVPEVNHTDLELPEASHYHEGVLFCGNHNKGAILNVFLAAIHYQPEQIILVDDKLYNLTAVAKLVAPEIDFVGLHYLGINQKIERFNPTQTHQELIDFLKTHPFNGFVPSHTKEQLCTN